MDERGFEPRASPMRRERDTPTPHTQGTKVRQVIPHLMALFNQQIQKQPYIWIIQKNMKISGSIKTLARYLVNSRK